MSDFITNGASVLPPVKSDVRVPTGGVGEWAADDCNEVRQALLDARSEIINIVQAGTGAGATTPVLANGTATTHTLGEWMGELVVAQADIAVSQADITAAEADIVAIQGDVGAIEADASSLPVTGTGSPTPRTLGARAVDWANALDYAADRTGANDNAAAFTAALAAKDHVVVPPGVYRLDSTVEIVEGKTFQLMGGVRILREAAHSAETTPMFWLTRSNASLIGAGFASTIQTENRAPNGVVLIGFESMVSTALPYSIQYNTLRGLRIVGAVSHGQVSGDPDACVKLIAPEFTQKVNYFHVIDSLVLNSSNYGLWLEGWANGLLMSNLHGYWIGNVAVDSALLYIHGALDNNLSGLFHHYSSNTTTILIRDLDNGGNGGSNHVTAYSSLRGIICEQGGANAKALVANAGCTAFKNNIEMIDNVTGGIDVSAAFRAINNIQQIQASTSFQGVATGAYDQAHTALNPDAAKGNLLTITASTNAGFSIGAPTSPTKGQPFTIRVKNTCGGAMGVIVWDAVYKMVAFTNPATANSRSVSFIYDGTDWVETNRSAADIPN